MKLTDKEILEYNQLIANFRGAKYDKDTNFPIHPDNLWLPIHGVVNYKTIRNGKIIRYHNSFEWIMDIVEQIEKLDLIDEFNICYDSVAKGHIVSITPAFKDAFNTIHTEVYEKKIDAIYDAVIQFIKWYNQNIKLKK